MDMVKVAHPRWSGIVREVPADAVAGWVAAGWVQGGDETAVEQPATVEAQPAASQQQPVENEQPDMVTPTPAEQRQDQSQP